MLMMQWAHSKSRRGTRTVDIEEEWQKKGEGGEGEGDDMSTVLENVKRSKSHLRLPVQDARLIFSQSGDSRWIRADWDVGRRVGYEA